MMTKKKLMQVYYIEKEIAAWKSELERLRADAYSVKYRVTNYYGKGRSASDIVAENAIKIAELEAKIEDRLWELRELKTEVCEYILSIEDPQTRLIFMLRCLKMMSWNAVADRVGGMNSEYSVKKRFYRHLEKCS